MGSTVKFDQEELILHLSDLHIGERASSPDNKYDSGIAKRRLEYYFDKVLRIARDIYSKAVPITRLHVILTGDMVHNETMRGSAKMSAEYNILDQIDAASDWLTEGIVNVVTRFSSIKEVKIYGVRGNHGRIGAPGDNDDRASYDNAVYQQLKLKLSLRKSELVALTNVKFDFNFSKDVYLQAKINGWWFVMEHWDNVKSQMNIPYYGLGRMRDLRYKSLRGKMSYYLGGHFHRNYKENDGTVTTLMCPSLVGANEYGDKFGHGNVSGQMMYLINNKHGITIERFISTSHIQEG